MSTDTILEILRHHDNPCAVLERVVPLFEPFELEPVMHYARAHFSRAPRLYVSILLAALNARCDAQLWHVCSDYERLEMMGTGSTSWGITSHHTMYHVTLQLKQRGPGGDRTLPIRVFYHPNLIPFQQPDMLILSLPFMFDIHQININVTFLECYAQGILEALRPHGATLVINHETLHPKLLVHMQDSLIVQAPLSAFAHIAAALHHAVLGDALLSRNPGTGEVIPGELFLRAVNILKLDAKEVHTWLNLTEDDVYDMRHGVDQDAHDRYDTDDIPF